MKKSHRLLSLVLLAPILCSNSYARIICDSSNNCYNKTTNPPTNDIWCNGGRVAGNSVLSYTEVCQDYLGNLVATSTSGVQALGTSSLPWENFYSMGETITGASVVGVIGTANATGTGNASGPSQISAVGGINLSTAQQVGSGQSQNLGITISTTIPVLSSYEVLLSSGGNILMTATPTISTLTVSGSGTGLNTVADGTILVLTSTSTTVITLQSNGALSGSLIKLGAATRAITQFKVLTLIFQKTLGMWLELAYAQDGN